MLDSESTEEIKEDWVTRLFKSAEEQEPPTPSTGGKKPTKKKGKSPKAKAKAKAKGKGQKKDISLRVIRVALVEPKSVRFESHYPLPGAQHAR